jgi:hypothetical protein
MIVAPKVDRRLASDITRQIRELLPHYVDRWPSEGVDGASDALTGIFFRYCELIIDRLNQVPDKNLLAFLNLFGVSLAPPQPARAPLTFYLSSPSAPETVVPALTQVAALPAKGEKEPVLFETEREFVITPAQLDSLWVFDGVRDRYSDYDDLLDQTALPLPSQPISDADYFERITLALTGKTAQPEDTSEFAADTAPDKRARLLERFMGRGVLMFAGNRPNEHFLYVGLPSASSALIWRELRLKVSIATDLASLPGSLQWEIWNGHSPVPLSPSADTTQSLTRSGEILFTDVLIPPLAAVGTGASRWLRGRWTAPDPGMPVRSALPMISDISVTTVISQQGAALEAAVLNTAPLDLSKEFFPFGERPKFGDTLYLFSEAFCSPGAAISLHVQMMNPSGGVGPTPVAPVKANAVVLRWEYWDGKAWLELRAPDPTAPRLRLVEPGQVRLVETRPSDAGLSDTTQVFTVSGQINFRFPSAPQPVLVNGQKKCWIRVRLVSGDYGRGMRYEHEAVRGSVLIPATYAPPLIQSVRVDQSVTVAGSPEAIVTYNDFEYHSVATPFAPFESSHEAQTCCYLGFAFEGRTFPSRSMSLYFNVTDSGEAPDDASFPVAWEYWNGKAWTAWTVRDETGSLRSSGLIRFLAPPDFSAISEFGRKRYWLRARKIRQVGFEPMLRRVLLNTTSATQTQTMLSEVLGSGTGKPGQVFYTTRKPILEGQTLEILEPSVPSSEERASVEREEGIDAVTVVPPTADGKPMQAWVRWHEVINFEASGPRDRHYVVDRPTGAIQFGDAVNGMPPPALRANVRMARYQTGGGSVGNKSAASIVQIKTTVPYVQRVTNFEDADGGADAELSQDILKRETHRIRHGGRAVTSEDFEDMALLASGEVARALCISMRDLREDRMALKPCPGVISLVVVPRWKDGATAPVPPSAELLARVRKYLDGRRFTGAKLVLVGPEYLRIDVRVEITVAEPDAASNVELGVKLALLSYLLPLDGFEGEGWDFGKAPAKSQICAFIETISGVEHVRSLEIQAVGDHPDTEQTARFLITPGDIEVRTTLEK